VEFDSLYTNTVIVTPYRGAGRPQGVYAMERTMDAIADHLGKDRAECARQLHPARRDALRPRPDLPGRPPLVYDSGDYPASMAKLKALVGWDDFEAYRDAGPREGAGSASASPATSRAPASARTRAGTCRSRPAARSRSPPA
jgi:carbon-monoxide dehydrogenase large subunit